MHSAASSHCSLSLPSSAEELEEREKRPHCLFALPRKIARRLSWGYFTAPKLTGPAGRGQHPKRRPADPLLLLDGAMEQNNEGKAERRGQSPAVAFPVDVSREAERRQAPPLLPARAVNGNEESRRQQKAHVFSSLASPSSCEATNLHLRRVWSFPPGDLQAAVDGDNEPSSPVWCVRRQQCLRGGELRILPRKLCLSWQRRHRSPLLRSKRLNAAAITKG
nr:hypothetical protein Iba_chr06aCG14030 [Ipomoea batatas]